MAIEIIDKLRKQGPKSDNSQRMREIMEEGRKQLNEEREKKRKLLAQEKERQSQLPDWDQDKKEPFDAPKAIKALYQLYDPSDEERLQKLLDNDQLVENHEFEYYLDHPEFKTIYEYTNWENSQR